jgi:hypothetical protein
LIRLAWRQSSIDLAQPQLTKFTEYTKKNILVSSKQSFAEASVMARVINTFKWIGKNPKKSIFLGIVGYYGVDYGREKYL